MTSVTLKISGMSCQGCVRNITGVLTALDGVAAAQVSLEAGEAQVDFTPERVSVEQLRDAIEGAGFDVLG